MKAFSLNLSRLKIKWAALSGVTIDRIMGIVLTLIGSGLAVYLAAQKLDLELLGFLTLNVPAFALTFLGVNFLVKAHYQTKEK